MLKFFNFLDKKYDIFTLFAIIFVNIGIFSLNNKYLKNNLVYVLFGIFILYIVLVIANNRNIIQEKTYKKILMYTFIVNLLVIFLLIYQIKSVYDHSIEIENITIYKHL